MSGGGSANEYVGFGWKSNLPRSSGKQADPVNRLSHAMASALTWKQPDTQLPPYPSSKACPTCGSTFSSGSGSSSACQMCAVRRKIPGSKGFRQALETHMAEEDYAKLLERCRSQSEYGTWLDSRQGANLQGWVGVAAAASRSREVQDEHGAVLFEPSGSWVFSPSEFGEGKAVPDGTVPDEKLGIEGVVGCSGPLAIVSDVEIAYAAARAVIVLNHQTRTQRTITLHDRKVSAICCLTNGAIIASGQDGPGGIIVLWSPASMQPLRRLSCGDGAVQSIQCSKMNSNFLSSSQQAVSDRELSIEACRLYVLMCGNGGQPTVAVIPLNRQQSKGQDSKHLLSCNVVYRASIPVPDAWTMCSIRDHKQGIIVGGNKMVKWLDLDAQRQDLSVRQGLFSGRAPIASVRCIIEHHGLTITGMDSGDIYVWDSGLKPSAVVYAAHQGPVTALLSCAENSTIVSAGMDGFLRLFNVVVCKTCFCAAAIMVDAASQLFVTCEACDGQSKPKLMSRFSLRNLSSSGLASVCVSLGLSGGCCFVTTSRGDIMQIRLSAFVPSHLKGKDASRSAQDAIHRGEAAVVSAGFGAAVTSIKSHQDEQRGGFFTTVDSEGLLTVWDIRSKLPVAVLDMEYPARSLAISHDGKKYAVGHVNGGITVWDVGRVLGLRKKASTDDQDESRSKKRGLYRVTFLTKDEKGAGCESMATALLCGDAGDSQTLHCYSSEQQTDSFAPGRARSFLLHTEETIGSLNSVRLANSGQGVSSKWIIERVFVYDIEHQTVFHGVPSRAVESGQPAVDSPIDDDELEQDYWTVHLITGPDRGAGTDASIHLELQGDISSVKIPLKKSFTHFDKFEKDNLDVFEIQCDPVGDIGLVRLVSDGRLLGADWQIHSLMLTKVSTGEKLFCDFGDEWIRKDRLSIERPPLQAYSYKIIVRTGNDNGAGTDSKVFAHVEGMCDGAPVTHSYRLRESFEHFDKFERGQTDTFLVYGSARFTTINKVTLSIDGGGLLPAWQLVWATIEEMGTSDQKKWYACSNQIGGQWIKKNLPAEFSVTSHPFARYHIGVITHDEKSSGTDANVFMSVFGRNSKTPEFKLAHSASHSDKFERGQTDWFEIVLPDVLGDISRLTIGHDATWFKSDWTLAEILIVHSEFGEAWSFPYGKKITKSDTRVDLFCSPMTGGCYEIEIRTGNQDKAGTDAKVNAVLRGTTDSSEQEHLSESMLNRNKWERGRTDKFVVRTQIALGGIEGLELSEDTSGILADWLVGEVMVCDLISGWEFTFPGGFWLRDNHSSMSLPVIARRQRRPFRLGGVVQEREEFANRGRRGYLKRHKECILWWQPRRSPVHALVWDPNDCMLAAGYTDGNIEVLASVSGKFKPIGTCTGHTSWVQTLDYSFDSSVLRSSSASGELLHWSMPSCKMSTHVMALRDLEWHTDTCPIAWTSKGVWPTGVGMEYIVCVARTNDRRVILTGDIAGQIRMFRYPAGAHQCEFLGYTAHSKYVSSITFNRDGTRVLTSGGEDGTVVIWRYEKQAKANVPTSYLITVVTADGVTNADTRANAFVILEGERGKTQKMWLNKNLSNPVSFLAGQEDDFQITTDFNLGDLMFLTVGHDNSGRSPEWFVDHIKITETVSQRVWYFPIGQWLARAKCTKRVPPSAGVPVRYAIKVFTANEKDASTTSKVRASILGSEGESPRWELAISSEHEIPFQRGECDTFHVISAKDLGDLQSVTLNIDGAGQYKEFTVQKIIVHNAVTKERWVFGPRERFSRSHAFHRISTDRVEYSVSVLPAEGGWSVTSAPSLLRITLTGQDGEIRNSRFGKVDEERGIGGGRNRFVYLFSSNKGDLGDLKTVRLIYKQQGNSSFAFDISRIVVTNMSSHARWIFPARSILNKEKTEIALTPDAATSYRTILETHASQDAGCDHAAFIRLTGRHGVTSEIPLIHAQRIFERKSVVSTDFIAPLLLGDVSVVRIGHDNSGTTPGWMLENVRVVEVLSEDSWQFKVQAFLEYPFTYTDVVPLKPVRQVYYVAVSTGNAEGAGTQCPVTVELYGGGVSSGPLLLVPENPDAKFELVSGTTERFPVVSTVKIPEIEYIIVRRGAREDSRNVVEGKQGWLLERVVIQEQIGNRSWTFLANQWIKEPALHRTLTPVNATAGSGMCKLVITVKTADSRGASNDRPVHVELFSEQGMSSGLMQLEPPRNSATKDGPPKITQRGQTDVFQVSSVQDVWPPIKAVLTLDTGKKADWQFDWMAVSLPKEEREKRLKAARRKARRAKKQAKRNFRQQQSKDETDSEDSDPELEGIDENAEKMDRLGAAEEAVEILFNGEGQWLNNKAPSLSIERADPLPCRIQLQVFTGQEFGAGTDSNIFCTLQGTAMTCEEFKLSKSSTHSDKFERGNMDLFDVIFPQSLGQLKNITLRSDGAGLASSWLVHKTNALDCLQGIEYMADFEQADLKKGQLECTKPFKRVSDVKADKDPSDSQQARGPRKFKVKVTTGNEKGGGSDGKVFLTLISDKGEQSGEYQLKQSLNNKTKFQRTNTDEFHVPSHGQQALNMKGKLSKISVRYDSLMAKWMLERVVIEEEEIVRVPISLPKRSTTEGSSNDTNAATSAESGPAESASNIQAVTHGVTDSDLEEAEVFTDKDGLKYKLVNRINKSVFIHKGWLNRKQRIAEIDLWDGQLHDYKIIVKTGNVKKAGTDGNIRIQVVGKNKLMSGVQKLQDSLEKNRDLFERDQVDSFNFVSNHDLKELDHIILYHDGTGGALNKVEWFVESVTVVDIVRDRKYNFPASHWMGKDTSELKVAVGDGKQSDEVKKKDYIISVLTSDVQNAKTSARGLISLYGKKSSVEQFVLKHSMNHTERFKRGQTDKFKLNCPSLGIIERIRIWHDGTGLRPAWHLNRVEVEQVDTGTVYEFNINNWLAVDKADAKTEREILLSGTRQGNEGKPDESSGSDAEGKSSKRMDDESDDELDGYGGLKKGGKMFYPPVMAARPSAWSVYDYRDLSMDMPFLPPGPVAYHTLEVAKRRAQRALPVGQFDVWAGVSSDEDASHSISSRSDDTSTDDSNSDSSRSRKRRSKRRKKSRRSRKGRKETDSSDESDESDEARTKEGGSKRKHQDKRRHSRKRDDGSSNVNRRRENGSATMMGAFPKQWA